MTIDGPFVLSVDTTTKLTGHVAGLATILNFNVNFQNDAEITVSRNN